MVRPFALLLLVASLAHADSGARLRAQQVAFERPVTVLDADVHLDDWALSGWFLHDPAADALQGYAQLERGPWRVGGGVLDRDAGAHLGFAPRGNWRWGAFRLQLGGDVALGAGLLDEHDGGFDGQELGADVFALGAGATLRLTWRPHRRAWVTGFAGGDGLAAAVSRDRATGLEALLNLPFDGALSSALSEARAGGGARLSVVPWAGAGARVVLHAEERWDWIQLDPVAVWASHDSSAPLPLAEAPWRSRREVGVSFEATQPLALRVSLSGRYTQDATALEGFADRDGWSLAAGLEARYGRFDLALSGRYHLRDHPAEVWWGRAWPRHQLRAALGWRGGLGEVEGRLEVGGQWTLADTWGAPQPGHAAYVQVTLWFGDGRERASRVTRPDPTRALGRWSGAVAYARVGGARGETSGDAPQVADAEAPATDPLAEQLADAPLPTLQDLDGFVRSFDYSELVELVDAYNELRRDGIEPQEVRDALAQRPQLTQRIEEHFPGLLEFAAGLFPGALPDDALGTAAQPGVFLLGYGRQGVALSPLRRRGAVAHADLSRADAFARDAAVTARADAFARDAASVARTDDPLSAPALAARWRLEKLSLWAPTGGDHRLVLQARSTWSTRMRQLLRGF